MDKRVRRKLMSSVDPFGNPKWKPATLEDVSEASFESIPQYEPQEVEASEIGDDFSAEAEMQDWLPKPTGQPFKRTGVDARKALIFIGAVGLFLFALLPRLYVLFYVTNPQNPGIGWYGDVFHHWQVAYLSKEIGFSKGFLRLWDFKGMEYFWGLLHPLVLAFLFKVTGSVDILIPRLLSVVMACASLAILFFLLRHHFNVHVALAGFALAALNPIAVFNDTVGMQEPLGLILLFTGLLLWPRRSTLAGFLWALAGLVRAEYWVFGAALVVIGFITEKESNTRLGLAFGWTVPSLLYMKYMLDYTGNPIYPIYWNFLAGTVGEWMEDIPLNTEQMRVQWAARIVLLCAVLAALWILRKRPKYTLFLLLGLGNTIMLGIVLGLGEYIHGYVTRVLFDRLMVVPYMYVGIFLAIGLLYYLPRQSHRRLWLAIGWLGILLALVASQIVWQPILATYQPLNNVWAAEKKISEEVASFYEGGTIAIPEDRQWLTYDLVRYHGIAAENLQSQMYDPFAYFEEDDPFESWGENRQALENWFKRLDIRLLVFYTGKWTYEQMVEREPTWFSSLATVARGSIKIYEVSVD